MISPTPLPSSDPRDPISAAIEDYLISEDEAGHGSLRRETGAEGVCMSFGTCSACAPNFDVAFIRLALALMDDHRYCSRLVSALRNNLELGRN